MHLRPSRGIALGLIAGGALLMGDPASAQEQQFITIGTGGVTGVYYPTGGAICRLVNQGRAEHGIRCSAESTEGSVFNLNSLRTGELDFGVVQSDIQYHAYNGSDRFENEGPFGDLRSVFSLHPEPFTVVVRPDSGISTFEDIVGKRVNVGNPGSGQRATVEVLMEAYGWTMDDFALASELPSREQAQALCDNQIDVILFTVGHPSGSIQEPIATCDARLISVEGEIVDQLVEQNPYYFHATIPAGMYPRHEEDVSTFGVGATFVTRADVADEVVFEVTKAVFDNFDSFTSLHPAFGILKQKTMVSTGLTAPLHDGAKRYFEEADLM
jgi:TRAP transporter TAXI family solute receptor